jgi:hypothetical protein
MILAIDALKIAAGEKNVTDPVLPINRRFFTAMNTNC